MQTMRLEAAMNSILEHLDGDGDDEEDSLEDLRTEEGTDVDQRASIPVYQMKFPDLFVYWWRHNRVRKQSQLLSITARTLLLKLW